MDWQLAIEKNREALKGILAMLATMAGFADLRPGDSRPATLPRHLHRSVLRLLRPAEAAVRRLIIVAARGLAVELPPRTPKPNPQSILRGLGLAIMLSPGARLGKVSAPSRRPATLSLPLLDPLKRWGARRRPKQRSMPRITFDFDRPRDAAPPPLTPDDPLDAGRLCRRLEVIGRALDDLPRQAKRLARWQARRDASLAQERETPDCQHPTPALRADPPHRGEGSRAGAPGKRHQRYSPMRPGRPPGWRRRPDHPVYEALNELHGLAVWARERADTS